MTMKKIWYCDCEHENEAWLTQCDSCGDPRPPDVDYFDIDTEEAEETVENGDENPTETTGETSGGSGIYDDIPAAETVFSGEASGFGDSPEETKKEDSNSFAYNDQPFDSLEKLADYIDTHFDLCRTLLDNPHRERLLLWASAFGKEMDALDTIMTEASKSWEERLEALRYSLNPLAERPKLAVNPEEIHIKVSKGAHKKRTLKISNTGGGRVHGNAVLREGNQRGAFRLEGDGQKGASVPFKGQKASVTIIADGRHLDAGDKRSTRLTLTAPNAQPHETEVALHMTVIRAWVLPATIALCAIGVFGGIAFATSLNQGAPAEQRNEGGEEVKVKEPEALTWPRTLGSSEMWKFNYFVTYLIGAQNKKRESALSFKYTPEARMPGGRIMTRDEITSHYKQQFNAWPIQENKLVKLLSIKELREGGPWQIEYTQDFDQHNPSLQKSQSGRIQVLLTVKADGNGSYLISEHKQRRIR